LICNASLPLRFSIAVTFAGVGDFLPRRAKLRDASANKANVRGLHAQAA
jgi:hypothetical protein